MPTDPKPEAVAPMMLLRANHSEGATDQRSEDRPRTRNGEIAPTALELQLAGELQDQHRELMSLREALKRAAWLDHSHHDPGTTIEGCAVHTCQMALAALAADSPTTDRRRALIPEPEAMWTSGVDGGGFEPYPTTDARPPATTDIIEPARRSRLPTMTNSGTYTGEDYQRRAARRRRRVREAQPTEQGKEDRNA